MSLTYLAYGALGLVGLLAALAASMTLAARVAARLVGIENFRWFEAQPAKAAWWRRLAVRLASVLAPLGVSIAVYWVSFGVAPLAQIVPVSFRRPRPRSATRSNASATLCCLPARAT